jgi:hypothetical protein
MAKRGRALGAVSVSAATALAVAGCGDDEEDGLGRIERLFHPSTTRIAFEIDYQPGAEPDFSKPPLAKTSFEIARESAARLFQGKNIEMPSALDGCEKLGDVSGASFTSEAIQSIAAAHRQQADGEGVATFYGVWLDGYYNDGSGDQKNVLGVSIGDTGLIAMFKPVIESVADMIEGFVEQTTFAHEFGHGAGLVDRGVPLTSNHRDDSINPHHCSNQDCVLYAQNEGAADIVPFVQKVVATGQKVVFGSECLADTDAYAQSLAAE